MRKLPYLLILIILTCFAGSILYGSEAKAMDDVTTFLERLYYINGSKQAIVVSTENEGDFRADLEAYERKSEGWVKCFPAMNAVVGKNGFSTNKKEGDGKAPSGVFKIGQAFGIPNTLSLTKLPYKGTTDKDYWIDDVTSPDYNTWVEYSGNAENRWKSFERLNIPSYRYAFVIEYNMNPIIKGAGSAIFFHIWKDSNTGTSGCTAVSEPNILKLLGWLDPDKNPIILQGTESMIGDMMNTSEDRILYPVKAKLDGKEIAFDVYPRIVDGRTLVPIRAIFEEMMAKVSWEAATGTVRVKKGSTEIILVVGSKTAWVGGRRTELDVAATVVEGRTLVPVRFISEELGFKVGWDANKRTVLINSNKI